MAHRNYSYDDVRELARGFGIKLTKEEVVQLAVGMYEEQEHDDVTGGDPKLVFLIALAHVRELPDYYERLIAMETHAKGGPCACYFGRRGSFELPKDHQFGVRVPVGGAMCANCGWYAKGSEKCQNRGYQDWSRSIGVPERNAAFLPYPADQFACDLWERAR